jgi:hypothetical protein
MSKKALDDLGVAIADAGYTWTPEMRSAYEKGVQKEWIGLTDEEAQQLYMDTEQMVFDSSVGSGSVSLDFPICIYRAIEAKLKEKNT